MAVWNPTYVAPEQAGTGATPDVEPHPLSGRPLPGTQINGRNLSPQQAAARARIAEAYRKFLGREASEDEIASHLTNYQYVGPQNVATGENTIRESQEAQDYAKKQTAGGSGGTEDGTPNTSTTPVTTARSASPVEGFNRDRAQDPSFSAKDSFLQAWDAAPEPPPGTDKAALAGWFNTHIKPQMEKDGHKINWVEGDKMNFTSPQGTFTVDWVRGAGAEGWAGAWQVDDGSDANSGATGATGATSTPSSAVAIQQALAGGGGTNPTDNYSYAQNLIRQMLEKSQKNIPGIFNVV